MPVPMLDMLRGDLCGDGQAQTNYRQTAKAVSALNNAYYRTIRRILTAGDQRGCFRWLGWAWAVP